MVFSTKRRFIAGAVCPNCKKQDVVVVFHENHRDWQACVACDHQKPLIHQEDRGNDQQDTIPVRHIDLPAK
jgi:hypothetical protein